MRLVTAWGLAGHSNGELSHHTSPRRTREKEPFGVVLVTASERMSAASEPSTRRRASREARSVRHERSNLKMKKNSATFRKTRTSVTLVRMEGAGSVKPLGC